jgi:hypothetical protein
LSNHGVIPSPRIAMAVDTPEQGWVVLPTEGSASEVLDATAADENILSYTVQGRQYWSHVGEASVDQTDITWLLAGTLPDWGGTPLVLVITLEESNIQLARNIRDELLTDLVK